MSKTAARWWTHHAVITVSQPAVPLIVVAAYYDDEKDVVYEERHPCLGIETRVDKTYRKMFWPSSAHPVENPTCEPCPEDLKAEGWEYECEFTTHTPLFWDSDFGIVATDSPDVSGDCVHYYLTHDGDPSAAHKRVKAEQFLRVRNRKKERPK